MPADEDDVVEASAAPAASKAPAAPKGAGAGAVGVKRVPDVKPSGQTPEEARAALADYDKGVAKMEFNADKARALERVQNVAKLRHQGQAGMRPSYGLLPGSSLPGAAAPYVPSRAVEVRREQMPTVASKIPERETTRIVPRAERIQQPSEEELMNPHLGARNAAALAKQYRQENAAYDAGQAEIERAVRPQSAAERVDTSALPEKAKLQRERLQRVAELAESLRRYGWNEGDLAALGGIGVGTPRQ